VNRKTRSVSNAFAVLLSVSLLTFLLGSIHAFSVLIDPFEARLGASRASVSLVYSLALVSLTIAVLTGHHVYRRLAPGLLLLSSTTLAAVGLLVAAYATTLAQVILGYSLCFGLANGLGYGYGLQLVAYANPRRSGSVMAIVTACYAVGAIGFSLLLPVILQTVGFDVLLRVLSLIIFSGGLLAALIVARTGIYYGAPRSNNAVTGLTGDADITLRVLARFWFAYGLAVFAGLMAIGHAASIVAVHSDSVAERAAGVVMVALGNAIGGFVLALMIERVRLRHLLMYLPLLSALALLALTVSMSLVLTLGALVVVGFSYGAVIALYPAVVNRYAGEVQGPALYGKVFTAWGFAGLAAPWLAGALFDVSGNYRIALTVASVLSVVAGFVATRLVDTLNIRAL